MINGWRRADKEVRAGLEAFVLGAGDPEVLARALVLAGGELAAGAVVFEAGAPAAAEQAVALLAPGAGLVVLGVGVLGAIEPLRGAAISLRDHGASVPREEHDSME